jgi:hypothetical protein
MQTDMGKVPLILHSGQAAKWHFEQQMQFPQNHFQEREGVMVIKMRHVNKKKLRLMDCHKI